MDEIKNLEQFFTNNKSLFEESKYDKAMNILNDIKKEIEDYPKEENE